jgi:hypothetical protein
LGISFSNHYLVDISFSFKFELRFAVSDLIAACSLSPWERVRVRALVLTKTTFNLLAPLSPWERVRVRALVLTKTTFNLLAPLSPWERGWG